MQSRARGVDLGRLEEDIQETGKAGGRRAAETRYGSSGQKDGDGGTVPCRIVSWYGSAKSGHASVALQD
jgi:hypothetical protein